MAAYKETPRQKMIAMMYLVLTAMLVLNVSKAVIDAFIVVNDSIEETNENFNDKINQTYGKFREQHQINPTKVDSLWRKAQKIKTLSDDLRSFIAAVRDTAIMKSEHKTMEEIKAYVADEMDVSPEEVDEIPIGLLKSVDKYDETTNYFVPNLEQPRKRGMATEIRKKFLAYREEMLSLVPETARSRFQIGPNFDTTYYDADRKPVTWEVNNFYHTIMAADVTILNKLITEVNNSELDMLNFLYSSISEEDFKFSNVEAKVIPTKNYVLLGEEYKASVFVAAYDTTQRPEVYIQQGVDEITNLNNARRVQSVDEMVSLSLEGTSVGEQKYAGVIRMKSPDGSWNSYSFKDSFLVGRRSATVSATKMNVFYKGVENPLSISVPGVAASQLRPSINVGDLRMEGNGKYIVTIPGDVNQKATVRVNAIIDGEESFFEAYDFRVKRIPDPTPTIGGAYSSGDVERDFLKVSSIIAKTPESFDFDYTFLVEGFVMWYQGADGYWVDLESNSHKFTPEMLRLFDRLPINSRITFEDIKVKAPEGERTLKTTIAIKLR
jgi:gliding motility-associated protein GldM